MSLPRVQHQFIEVNDVRLHYTISGQGPLVLLLHGFPEFWYSWRHQIAPLAETHTVVAVDQRGYNTSSKPNSIAAYGIDQLVADIRAFIPALGFTEATIVGHDWGGIVAWAFAMRHPALLQRLAILNVPHPVLFRAAMKHNWRQRLRSWYIGFFQIPHLAEWCIHASDYRLLEQTLTRWVHRSDVFSADDLAVYRQAWSQPGALTAMINWYRALGRGYGSSLLRLSRDPIEAPTLLIWGTDDKALGQELTYGTERFVHDLRIRYLHDVSHWVQQEAPDQVNALLVPFVRGEY